MDLRANTAVDVLIGPFVDSTDGNTAETGLTIAQADVRLSKNGQNMAQKNDVTACVHDELGYYNCELDATDTDTEGNLVLCVHETGALPVRHEFNVLSEAAWDSLYAAKDSGYMNVNVNTVNETAQTANDNGADINTLLTRVVGTIAAGTHNPQSGDAYSIVNDGTYGNAAIETLVDELESRLTAVRAGYLDNLSAGAVALQSTLTALNDLSTGDIDARLAAIGLDHLLSAAVTGTDVTDNSIIAKLVSSSVTADWDTYDNTSDSLQSIRDRGDSAWTTGGGGSLSEILNIQTLIPNDIDLANTATVRIGLGLTNMLDDLPTTAEIAPGTIDIHRKAIGGTSWSAVVSGAACSEVAGIVYYDEVFDSSSGYDEGDSIRITFRNQSITVDSNAHEITGTDGWMFQTSIRQTMRGTDSAPTAVQVRQEMDSNSTQLAAIVADTDEIQGKLPLNNIMGSSDTADHDTDIDTILVDTSEIQSKLPLNNIMGSSDTADHDTDIDAILADTTELQGDWADGGRLDNILDSILVDTGTTLDDKIDTIDTYVAAILDDTGTSGVQVADKTGYRLSTTGIDDIHDEVIESTITLRQAIRLFLSVLTGISGGGGSATLTFRDIANTKNRISATVDSNGNRTAVGTRDGT